MKKATRYVVFDSEEAYWVFDAAGEPKQVNRADILSDLLAEHAYEDVLDGLRYWVRQDSAMDKPGG